MKPIIFLAFLVLIFSCNPPQAVNDFFGIQMPDSDAEYFKIYSYNELDGIQYQSNYNMNPNVLAWAELQGPEILIKIVNNSDQELRYNYNTDIFSFVSDIDKEFVLIKPVRTEYPDDYKIKPAGSEQFKLQIPSDFWNVIGSRTYINENPDLADKFWKGESGVSLSKDKIKSIKIILNGELNIILKPVPEKK